MTGSVPWIAALEPIVIRLEDHPTHPGGWEDLPRDVEFTPWSENLPPGTQSGTYFKSVRTSEDGREIWTWGRIDPETLAAGWTARGGRRPTNSHPQPKETP